MSALGWVLRDTPLLPGAVAARGRVARRLAERLLQGGREDLQGVAGADWLFVVGADLPWVDGVHWLGLEPGVRGLWLPTTHAPDVPPQLLAQTVRERIGLPAVCLPHATLAAGSVGPVHLDHLAAWRVR